MPSQSQIFSKSIAGRLQNGNKLSQIIQEEVDKGAIKQSGFEGSTFLTFPDMSRAMIDPNVGACYNSPAGLSEDDFLKWKVSVCSGGY